MVARSITFRDCGFHWLDVVDPTPDELDEIAKRYGLHPTSVQDCLDPQHLPKFEKIGGITFMITRAYDEWSSAEADTVQELTRKVAVFFAEGFLITIHRKDQPFLAELRKKWCEVPAPRGDRLSQVLSDVLRSTILSYAKPIDRALAQLEELETRTFRSDKSMMINEEGYYLKRKASLFRRMLRLTIELLNRLSHLNEQSGPWFQDVRDSAERLYFFSDELVENVNNLLSMQISIQSNRTNEASHRANEVMRVLTLFSVFFLPLNFIAGIYGMNFEVMPELKWQWGYFAVLGVMVLIAGAIFAWFWRKGFLHKA